MGRTDPCRLVKCLHGQRCIVDKVSAQARCVCAEDTACNDDDSGDNAGGPVCGNDWKDYPSACHVRKAACASGLNIAVKYRGLCGTFNDDNIIIYFSYYERFQLLNDSYKKNPER